MLVLVGPLAPVSTTYAASANASPNPAILGTFVTVSGSGFQPNSVFPILFAPGGGCSGLFFADQLGSGGGGVGVLGFAPDQEDPPFPFGNLFLVTTDNSGAFSVSIFLGDTFSATNYSIQGLGFDGVNTFCIDPFTIVLEICVIQLGVEQPAGAVLWLPGYAYPGLLPSSCPDVTEQYIDGSGVYGGMIVVHQFVQNRTFFTEPITIVPLIIGPQT